MRPSNSTRHFYPRPPRGGRLHTIRVNGWGESISIHALREEGDTEQQHKASTRKKFLSTPSARRATQWRTVALATGEISIHALREEGDRIRARIVEVQVISIHALREEGDPAEQKCSCGVKRFLSTPSARRATSAARASRTRYFYPRPPRGGRLRFKPKSTPLLNFYPRPPRGGRPFWEQVSFLPTLFLSTPSARRATHKSRNPKGKVQFLSTPSARRATFRPTIVIYLFFISIHALREEGDRWATIPAQLPTHFYPRPPRGGRPVSLPLGIVLRSISIHALREEGDNLHLWQRDGRHISIHALREEGDQPW